MAAAPKLKVSSVIALQPMKPREAMEWFKKRGLAPAWDYFDAYHAARKNAFAVAGITKLDLLDDLKKAIDEAVSKGLAFKDFKKRARKILGSYGWLGPRPVKDPVTGESRQVLINTSSRLENIYRTNTMSAFNAGHEMQIDAIAKTRLKHGIQTFCRFAIIDDGHTCDNCFELADTIAPYDDPIWEHISPPIHYQDRCVKESFGEDEAEGLGFDVSQKPKKLEFTTTAHPRTGAKVRHAVNVLPGFGSRFGWSDDVADDLNEAKKDATSENARAVERNEGPGLRVRMALMAAWDESKHPRADDGKFGEGGQALTDQQHHDFDQWGISEDKVKDAHEAKIFLAYLEESGTWNNGLRGELGGAAHKPSPDEMKTLDNIIARNKLDKPLTVYRGISALDYKIGQDGILKDSAWLSTTTDKSIAKDFATKFSNRTDDAYILECDLPQGASALVTGSTEEEVLLPRHSKLKVVGTDRFGPIKVIKAKLVSK